MRLDNKVTDFLLRSIILTLLIVLIILLMQNTPAIKIRSGNIAYTSVLPIFCLFKLLKTHFRKILKLGALAIVASFFQGYTEAGVLYHLSHQGYTGAFNHWNRQTWYIGYTENFYYYNRYMEGTIIDDGIFVAIPDGVGPYNGYSYYEVVHSYTGATDGGPALLPEDPKEFLERLKNNNAQDIIPEKLDYYADENHLKPYLRGLKKFDVGRARLPALPQGAILPPGSLLFFWVSRGGWYKLGINFISSQLPTKRVVISGQNVPEGEELIWYEPSEVTTVELNFIMYTEEELYEFVRKHLTFPKE